MAPYETYDFSNPEITRNHLLELEYAEVRWHGIGQAVAEVGCATIVSSLIFLGASQVVPFDPIEKFSQGGICVGAALIAAGGIGAVYERVAAYRARRNMRSFVGAWIESREHKL